MSVFIAPLHQFDWWQAKGKINIKRNVILSKNGVIKGVSWRKRDKKTKGNRRAEFSDALTRNGTRCIMRSARSRWGEQREKSRLRETTTFRLPCRKSSWKGRKKKKNNKVCKADFLHFFCALHYHFMEPNQSSLFKLMLLCRPSFIYIFFVYTIWIIFRDRSASVSCKGWYTVILISFSSQTSMALIFLAFLFFSGE